jgi:hypothetical protein
MIVKSSNNLNYSNKKESNGRRIRQKSKRDKNGLCDKTGKEMNVQKT